MKKVLLVSNVLKLHVFQFHIPMIKKLKEMGYKVDVAAYDDFEKEDNPSFNDFDNFVSLKKFSTTNPLSISSLKNYRILKNQIKKDNYDVVYCHTPIASAYARFAARNSKSKVIYIAHGFHFFKGSPAINWLFFPIEWVLSYITDVLVLINTFDYDLAKKYFHAKKIVKIPGIGIDYFRFFNAKNHREKVLNDLLIPQDAFVILSVAELQNVKNQINMIKAMKLINDKSIYLVLAGQGSNQKKYEKLIDELGLSNNIKLIGYRYDTDDLYKAADCFIHIATREGLGLAPLEAMASGLPLIASEIGGMREYVKNGVTGYTVNPYSINEIAVSIINMKSDTEFRKSCSNNNKEISKEYDMKYSIEILERVFKEIND